MFNKPTDSNTVSASGASCEKGSLPAPHCGSTKEADMAQAVVAIDLAVPADEVWELIGGFGSLPDWQPNIPQLELSEGGRVRRFMIDGSPIVERLIAFDH